MEKINTEEIQEGHIVHFRNGGKTTCLKTCGMLHLDGLLIWSKWSSEGRFNPRVETGFDIVRVEKKKVEVWEFLIRVNSTKHDVYDSISIDSLDYFKEKLRANEDIYKITITPTTQTIERI